MNKLLSTISLAAALALGSISSADDGWYGKAGVLSISESDSGQSLDLVGLYVGAGYEFEAGNNFFVSPEFRVATGINEDDVFGADVDIDLAWIASVRGIWRDESGFYAFGTLGYGDLKLNVSTGFGSGSGSADDMLIGAGIGYEFSKKFSLELSFEDFDGSSVFQVGSNFRF